MNVRFAILMLALTIGAASLASGQLAESFTPARLHPAIAYADPTTDDPVAAVNARLRSGALTLTREPDSGYLRAVLDAFGIVPESQVLVFSKTSFQAAFINPQNPRALFFGDDVSVGWVRGGDVIEVASQDPRQGTIFYTMSQQADRAPTFTRNDSCVSCHLSTATFDVPGMFAASMFIRHDGTPLYAPVYPMDHRTRLDQRWGGWYVTGGHGAARHMGNATAASEADLEGFVRDEHQNLRSLEGRVDLAGYVAQTSDIVALMVLEHQMHMANMFTRLAWETRLDTPVARSMRVIEPVRPQSRIIEATRVGAKGVMNLKLRPLDEAAADTVDYMLYAYEAPFEAPIEGLSGFAEQFSRRGPHDSRGRSLRELDLTSRLARYPLTYMIYSAQFDALPAVAKDAVYRRLWDVLSGAHVQPMHASHLPLHTRQAIVEILRETKPGLPEYFQTSFR